MNKIYHVKQKNYRVQIRYELVRICMLQVRMRFNHGLFPAHLFKINLSDSRNCVCGEIADLQHMVLECREKQNIINILIEQLYKENIEKPFNLKYLLAIKNENVYRLLYKYVIKQKIKL